MSSYPNFEYLIYLMKLKIVMNLKIVYYLEFWKLFVFVIYSRLVQFICYVMLTIIAGLNAIEEN